jgi:hypothetical protein
MVDREYSESGKRNAFLKFLAGLGGAAGIAVVAPGLAKAASEYQPVRAPEFAPGDKFDWLPVEGDVAQLFKDVENPNIGWKWKSITRLDGVQTGSDPLVDPNLSTQGVYERTILAQMGPHPVSGEFSFSIKGACEDEIIPKTLNQKGDGYVAINKSGKQVDFFMNPEAVLSAWERFRDAGKISLLASGRVTTEIHPPGYRNPEVIDMQEANRLGINPIYATVMKYEKIEPNKGIDVVNVSGSSAAAKEYYMIRVERQDGTVSYLKSVPMSNRNIHTG